MRRLFSFIFQLLAAVVFFFFLTAATMVFYGLNDQADKVDVALVANHIAPEKSAVDPVLDRVVELYIAGKIKSVLVIGSIWHESGYEDAAAMKKYLVDRGVPPDSILESSHGGTMQETARHVAAIVKEHTFESVVIVADYDDIMRQKMALDHEGVLNVEKVHAGSVRKEDAIRIGTSVFALYEYIGKVYLLPEADKVKKEAQEGMDKASLEAQHAKEKVDKGLNNLPK